MEKIFSKTSRYSTESVQTENLGIASPVPMGSWNKAIMYQKLNYVRHNQATYLAKKSNTNFEPGVATNWEDVWMLLNYDGGSVSPDGTYPNMTVGNSPKSLYNLGAYDTYVDNGDGTVTVTRKTGYCRVDGSEDFVESNTDIATVHRYVTGGGLPITDEQASDNVNYKSSWISVSPNNTYQRMNGVAIDPNGSIIIYNEDYQDNLDGLKQWLASEPIYIQYKLRTPFTETLISQVPLNALDQNMSNIVRDEVEKTLNLADIQKQITINSGTEQWVSYTIALKAGTYTISSSNIPDGIICQIIINGDFLCIANNYHIFTIKNDLSVTVRFGNNQVSQDTTFTPTIMLNEGSHAYPYQPYNGAIVHEIRTPLYFSTDNVSPASIDQIGGNWTSLGSFMVGSNTIYAWKKA